MATVVVSDLQHVVIDGETVGDVTSAIANYAPRAVEIQAALSAFVDTKVSSAVAELQAECNQLRTERDLEVKDNGALRAAQTAYLNNSAAGEALLKQMELEAAQANAAYWSQRISQMTGV